MARKVLRSLGSIVADAQRRGYVAQNVCAGVTVKRDKRGRAKPTIPSKADMRAVIAAAMKSAQPMNAALAVTQIFTGLRASELRGLSWPQIDLKAKTLQVDRRADSKNKIGPPKSAAGHRIIPLADVVVSELRKWKLRCPKTELALVFPSERKAVLSHTSLHRLHLWPLQEAAKLKHRYSSHAFRHCAASLWIEQRVSPKRVQAWMGHSSIQVTFDTYGHLFDQADADSAVMDAVQNDLIGDPHAA
jgi:integrase